MEIKNIKLIIWDLDETFWKGILSEGDVFIPKNNIELIKNLVDSGVMVSICSKNDKDKVDDILKRNGLFDLFVFKSVDWSPKGTRVKQIISEMNLREENVLFIDDNISNRQEVKNYCPKITVEDVDYIDELTSFFSINNKTDLKHKRLNQYKILEEKIKFKSTFGSNEDFLYNSEIIVEIHKDSINEIERIHELISRSNQLNFTKNRSSFDELKKDIEDKNTDCGYVCVHDKFGDYGIVGFYLFSNNKIKHFVFSCRTLGMGVEQYVFNLIGKPEFPVVGEVSSTLDGPAPSWINLTSKKETQNSNVINVKTIVKGPCDLAQTTLYFSGKNIETEFVYVNDKGVVIEQGNHTSIICDILKKDEEIKNFLINDLPFMDNNVYKTRIFDEDVGLVVLSLFTDPNLGLYQNKKNGAVIPFGEYTNDLTDKTKWRDLMSGNLFNANCVFTEATLDYIKDHYNFIGRMSPETIIDNLYFILSHMNQNAKLCLVIGSETPFLNNKNEAYSDRHIYNKQLNELVRVFASKNANRVFVIDVNEFIDGQESFTNNINHFQRIVYYKMAQKLISISNSLNLGFKEDTKIKSFFKKYGRKFGNLFKHPISVLKGRINRYKMRKNENKKTTLHS